MTIDSERNVNHDGPRVISILGMHRSGTSCLAGTLMECGVHFGNVSRANRHNAKGNNENSRIMALNDSILAGSGGRWEDPPRKVRWQLQHERERDAIIREYAQAGATCWGFKDPRTLLTFDGWHAALPQLQAVGIFRHPEAVALSLSRRRQSTPGGEFPRTKALALWYQYNRKLFDLGRTYRFPIVCFDLVNDDFVNCLDAVIAGLGLAKPAEGFEFYDPGLRHCQPEFQATLPTEIAELHRQLQEYAKRSCRHEPLVSTTPTDRAA